MVVFLDRDGTINIDYGYVGNPSQIALVPGSDQAVSLLKKIGARLAVVSNQSGVGRGMYTNDDVKKCNQQLAKLLRVAAPEAKIDDYLWCPHLDKNDCSCRKPKTGMVDIQKFEKYAPSADWWVVGDKLSDIEFGEALGVLPFKRILVLTGEGESSLFAVRAKYPETLVFRNLLQAAKAIELYYSLEEED